MKAFKKVVRIGSHKFKGKIFCEIEFTEEGKLSIVGVEGPRASGNCKGYSGQIEMHMTPEYFKEVKFAKGWNRQQAEKFVSTWQEWHLNDMKAGLPSQEQAIKEWLKAGNRYDYTQACEMLKSKGLYEVDGYKYGTGWKRQEVPADVIEFLKGLPDTDETPAWV